MIVFTDLDNCMLDSGYSASVLRDFIRGLISKGIELSVISSKTEKEILYHLGELGIKASYGAENGCLVVVGGNRYELGTKSKVIKDVLRDSFKKFEVDIELLSEMSDKEIKKITNLPEHLIPLARERFFSEPFRIVSGDSRGFLEGLNSRGYSIRWGGKFYQISRGCSKGRAVRLIREYTSEYAIGIGDSENDYPMLDECDYPIILNSNNDSRYKNYKQYGPKVWEEAVKKAIEEING